MYRTEKDSIKIKDQKEIFIHLTLENDEAYKWSVENNDPINMQMVLRAYKEKYDFDSAVAQIRVAKELA